MALDDEIRLTTVESKLRKMEALNAPSRKEFNAVRDKITQITAGMLVARWVVGLALAVLAIAVSRGM